MFNYGVIIALSSYLLAASAMAQAPCSLPFESLHFSASKALILSGDVLLEARLLPAETAGSPLRSCPEGGGLAPKGDCLVVIDAKTDASFHHSTEKTWIAGEDGGVLQVEATRRNRRWRLSRATADGQHDWTRRPASKRERKAPDETWTDISEEHRAWVPAPTGLPRTSSFGLLYQAAAFRLDREGATAVVEVHSKGQLLQVTLTALDLVEVSIDLRRKQGGEVQRLDGKVQLRRVSVTGDAVDSESSDSPVGLLGMSSGIELFLEIGTGLPVEVRGKVPKLGELRVRLVEAVLPPA